MTGTSPGYPLRPRGALNNDHGATHVLHFGHCARVLAICESGQGRPGDREARVCGLEVVPDDGDGLPAALHVGLSAVREFLLDVELEAAALSRLAQLREDLVLHCAH